MGCEGHAKSVRKLRGDIVKAAVVAENADLLLRIRHCAPNSQSVILSQSSCMNKWLKQEESKVVEASVTALVRLRKKP